MILMVLATVLSSIIINTHISTTNDNVVCDVVDNHQRCFGQWLSLAFVMKAMSTMLSSVIADEYLSMILQLVILYELLININFRQGYHGLFCQ